eukprot:1153084-Pelagomonas_calceolata.AAC.6
MATGEPSLREPTGTVSVGQAPRKPSALKQLRKKIRAVRKATRPEALIACAGDMRDAGHHKT